MTQNKCFIILGMYRSGASALAGSMNLLGFNLGDSLASDSGEAQAGSFENQDIVLTHDILLRDLGCSWDMVGSLPQGWLESQAAAKAEMTLSGILERQFVHRPEPFAIKDPRLCRLMPLWERVFTRFNIQPTMILVLRHPMEVAKSLHKRNGLDLLKGHLLWLVYNRKALAACKDHEHMLITYDQLLADPVTVLDSAARLSAFSGTSPMDKTQDILSLVRPELKNFHQGEAEEMKDGLFRHYDWVYTQFRSLQVQNRLSRAQDAEHGQNRTTFPLPEVMAQFPLAVSDTQIIPAQDERRHAAEILDNLLSVIGHFEKKELDLGIQRQKRLLAATNAAEILYAQVLCPVQRAEGREQTGQEGTKVLLAPEEWQQVVAHIPDPGALKTKGLRISPLNTRGLVSISNISLVNTANGQECWRAMEGFSGISVQGDAFLSAQNSSLEIVVTGNNPYLVLPDIPELPDCPLDLHVWVRPSRRQTALHTRWQELKKEKEEGAVTIQTLQQQIAEHEQSVTALENELNKQKELTREYFSLLSQAETEQEKIQEQNNQQLGKLNKKLKQAQAWVKELEEQIEAKEQTITGVQQKLESQKELGAKYSDELESAEKEREQLLASEDELKTQLATSQYRKQELEEQLKAKDQTLAELQDRVQKKDEALEKYAHEMQVQKKFLEQEYTAKLESEKKKRDKLHKENNTQIAELQRQMEEIKDTKQEIENDLSDQKDLTRKYYQALSDAESDNVQLHSQVKALEESNRQILQVTRNLQSELHALQASKPWKVRSALFGRAKVFESVQRMEDLFTRLEKHQTMLQSGTGSEKPHADSDQQLISWMERLDKDFQAIMRSRRWKLGHALISGSVKVVGQSREPISVNRMYRIFEEFREWKKSAQKRSISKQESKQLQKWMDRLEKDFQALRISRRWRLGTALLLPARLLFWREKKPRPMDQVQEIFEKYNASGRVV